MLGPAKRRNSDQFFEARLRWARLRAAASSASFGELLDAGLAVCSPGRSLVSGAVVIAGPPLCAHQASLIMRRRNDAKLAYR